VLPHDAAAVLYDTTVAYLRLGLRTILVLALVVAGGALVTGQSATAVRVRHSLAAGIGRLRGGAEHAGWRTGPVGTWVYANKTLLRIAAVTLAALALVFWGQPTGKTILVVGRAAAGRPGPDRIPRPATSTHRRLPNPHLNPAPAPRHPSACVKALPCWLQRALRWLRCASRPVRPSSRRCAAARISWMIKQRRPARRVDPMEYHGG
jgi:hypothetical protein